MREITVYSDSSGHPLISRTESYLAWKRQGITAPRLDDQGLCTLCHGDRTIRTIQYGWMRCICEIADERKALKDELKPYWSLAQVESLETLVIASQYREWWQETRAGLLHWMDWPDHWITIYGGVGSGKTHILSALMAEFSDFCLYITESDFEAKLSAILDKGERSEETISEMVDILRHVPILFYDDAGSGYTKAGKDYTRSKLRNIIDFRYQLHREYLTVIATNLDPYGLREWDARIADRILDTSPYLGGPRVWLIHNPLPSWRTKDVNQDRQFRATVR